MSFPRKKWRKLEDYRDFEELCTHILTKQYKSKWSNYGRIGQHQEGRDALYLEQNKHLIVAQFKNYTEPNAKRLISDITKDVKSIISKGNVEKIIIMTSHDKDKHVQDAVIELRKKYNLTIDDMYWDDITKSIDKYKTLMRKYYPELIPTQMASKNFSAKSFENSKTHYQLLSAGRFAYLKFDETLLTGTKPLKTGVPPT
ncbi:MAG: hypothetical protein FWH37_08110 [Candidatus Bathyarchaeota archaeon]|nr:hypothetical protein [Candidatus Termiticorpusculum sp.]